jgi:hypothetical protein
MAYERVRPGIIVKRVKTINLNYKKEVKLIVHYLAHLLHLLQLWCHRISSLAADHLGAKPARSGEASSCGAGTFNFF